MTNWWKKNTDIKGRWWNIDNKIKKTITAKYDKKKDWVMDPKGYFLIKIDNKNKLIRVGFCRIVKVNNKNLHELIYEINGRTSIEIVNTLIKEELISSLQHAADMGIELNKAEIALNNNLDYIQDSELNFSK